MGSDLHMGPSALPIRKKIPAITLLFLLGEVIPEAWSELPFPRQSAGCIHLSALPVSEPQTYYTGAELQRQISREGVCLWCFHSFHLFGPLPLPSVDSAGGPPLFEVYHPAAFLIVIAGNWSTSLPPAHNP